MKIIVGLGNPGKKYEHTRHNAGFLAIDDFIGELMSDPKTPGSFTLRSEIKFHGQIIPLPNFQGLLFKPQTFMNESGSAVKKICDFYKVDVAKDLSIIHDDTDLPLGTIRTTGSSSAAGHNGVQDIIQNLSTQDFHRVRIGVESRASRDDMPTEAYVLQNFSADELKILNADVFPKVKLEIKRFINDKN